MTDLLPLLDHPTAIVGTTGSGKTYAAKGAVEQLLDEGRRVIIIDPTGAWFGLRSAPDGAGGGYSVMIFGGDHADVDISPDAETGKALALELATREVQAIIDTSGMTGGEKNRFLTPFLEHLYANNRAALHIIVDEADEIAAQRLADGEQRLFGVFDKIVRRGRIKGFRPLMITQRPAVIHKNVLSQIGTLIAMKLTSPQDRKAIEEWVKGNADTEQARVVVTSMPRLSRGEGWVWSPADDVLERTMFPPIRTYDSSRTPEIGEVITAPALAAVDVAALRGALRKDDAEDTPQAKASGADLKAAETRGYKRGMDEGYRMGASALIELMGWTIEEIDDFRDRVSKAFDEMSLGEAGQEITKRRSTAGSPSGKAADFDSAIAGSNPAPATTLPVRRSKRAVTSGEKTQVSDPLLTAALQVWPAKMTWAGLAAMCGRKARGGHFNSVRKRLIDSGAVRMDGDLVIPADPPETPAGAIPADLLEQNLPQPAAKMFATIRGRESLTIEELGLALGMQTRGGHWNNGMAILRRNGLIDEFDGFLSVKEELL